MPSTTTAATATTTATTEIISSLTAVNSREWNALNYDHSPFLRYEFLIALEQHEAVGKRYGWLPCFVIMRDAHGQLVGAMPLYEKHNSYGELVFDWAWADAYHRHGLPYYPKLVAAIPYTPATGQRLLSRDNAPEIQRQLLQTALDYCMDNHYSSLHCLFPTTQQLQLMRDAGMSDRIDVQYHWHNQNYDDFTAFLATLRHSKRKKIKQERRRISERKLEFRICHGDELNANEWHEVHRFYAATFQHKGGYATLNLDFWKTIGDSMGEQVVVVMAYLRGTAIGCAINFRSHDVLYGRHWGCDPAHAGNISGLHFETCYYQGIEYAIAHRLKRFEPGAQGEYKMSRGFVPSITHSAHWISNADFRDAIHQFTQKEAAAVNHYQQILEDSSAYRKND